MRRSQAVIRQYHIKGTSKGSAWNGTYLRRRGRRLRLKQVAARKERSVFRGVRCTTVCPGIRFANSGLRLIKCHSGPRDLFWALPKINHAHPIWMPKPTKLVGECSNICGGCRGFSSNKRQVGQAKNGRDVESIASFDFADNVPRAVCSTHGIRCKAHS